MKEKLEAEENCIMRCFIISLLSHAYTTCPAHFVLIDLITLTIFGEWCEV
jgi:hypothetical protein